MRQAFIRASSLRLAGLPLSLVVGVACHRANPNDLADASPLPGSSLAPDEPALGRASASAGDPTPTSSTVVTSPPPRVQEIPELDNATQAEIDDDGWVGAVRAGASDAASTEPLTLVWAKWGKTPERAPLPCSSATLIAANLGVHRILWADGKPDQRHLHIWQNRDAGATVDGPFIGGALGVSQALVTTGHLTRQAPEAPNGAFVLRYKNGSFNPIALPGPPEKNWHDCQWDVLAKPRSDDFVLEQTCSAPHRETAYAVYRLEADSAELVRVPFDNKLFDPVKAHANAFIVEEDGTVDVANDNPDHLTLARLHPGKDDWEAVVIRTPARLDSSVGASGPHILVASGEGAPRESVDAGETFHDVPLLGAKSGIITECRGIGCLFLGYPSGRALVWHWSPAALAK